MVTTTKEKELFKSKMASASANDSSLIKIFQEHGGVIKGRKMLVDHGGMNEFQGQQQLYTYHHHQQQQHINEAYCHNLVSSEYITTCSQRTVPCRLSSDQIFELTSHWGRQCFLNKKYSQALLYYGHALQCKNPDDFLLEPDQAPEFVRRRVSCILFDIGLIHLGEEGEQIISRGYFLPFVPTSTAFSSSSISTASLEMSLSAFSLSLDVRRTFCCKSHDDAVALARGLYWLAILQEGMDHLHDALECAVEAVGMVGEEDEDDVQEDCHCECTDNTENEEENLDLFKCNEAAFTFWVTLGRIQLALDQNDDAQSSFQEAGRIAILQLLRQRRRQLFCLPDAHNSTESACTNRMCHYLICSSGNSLEDVEDLNEALTFFRTIASPLYETWTLTNIRSAAPCA